MQASITLNKRLKKTVQVEMQTTPFPGCCGIVICRYPKLIYPPGMHFASNEGIEFRKYALRNKKKMYKALEEAMLKRLRGYGMIVASDGVDSRNPKKSSRTSDALNITDFVEACDWRKSEMAPNPTHGGNTLNYVAWKVIPREPTVSPTVGLQNAEYNM